MDGDNCMPVSGKSFQRSVVRGQLPGGMAARGMDAECGRPLDCERGRMVWRRVLWQNDCSDGSDPAGAGLSRAEWILYGNAYASAVRRFLDRVCDWNFDCRRGGWPAVCAAFFSPPPQRAAGRVIGAICSD